MVAVLGPIVGAMNAAGLPNLAGQPWLIGAVLFVALSPALAGIVTGVVAVIRRGEHSILVIGRALLVVLFLLAEVTQERTRRMIPAMGRGGFHGQQGCRPAREVVMATVPETWRNIPKCRLPCAQTRTPPYALAS